MNKEMVDGFLEEKAGGGGEAGGGSPIPENCPICDCKYKETGRKFRRVSCTFCEYSTCNTCCETYVLSKPNEAHCMNPECKKQFPRKFMYDSFAQQFLNVRYKAHRENYLFEAENAKMAGTQAFVEAVVSTEELRMHIIHQKEKLGHMKRSIVESCQRLSRQQQLLGQYTDRTGFGGRHVGGVGDEDGEDGDGSSSARRQVFMHRCPDPECRGFVSSQWKCGMCKNWSCPECHEIKGLERENDTHQCNPDVVATVALMRRDTKPCPGCHTQIHKVDGCDQMWCTICHTAFSWTTGLVEKNRIHNPHYYQYLRENAADGEIPREPGDGGGGGVGGGGCGARNREITHHTSTELVNSFRKHRTVARTAPFDLGGGGGECTKSVNELDEEEDKEARVKFCSDSLFTFVRSFLHLTNVSLRVYLYVERPEYIERENRHLRMDFLRKRLDEKRFKLVLQRNDKRRAKVQELRDVYEMFIDSTTDIIYRFMSHIRSAEPQQIDYSILNEIYHLIDYANKHIRDIMTTYSCVAVLIDKPRLYIE